MPRGIKDRNMGTWTQAMLMGRIRSALRRIWSYYLPRKEAKIASRKTVKGKRHRYEYKCAHCHNWFKDKQVEVGHKIGAGSLKSFSDLPQFCERLFCEDPKGYEVVCKPCHKKVTAAERKKRK